MRYKLCQYMNEDTEEYQVNPERKYQRVVSLPVPTDVVQYMLTKHFIFSGINSA